MLVIHYNIGTTTTTKIYRKMKIFEDIVGKERMEAYHLLAFCCSSALRDFLNLAYAKAIDTHQREMRLHTYNE